MKWGGSRGRAYPRRSPPRGRPTGQPGRHRLFFPASSGVKAPRDDPRRQLLSHCAPTRRLACFLPTAVGMRPGCQTVIRPTPTVNPISDEFVVRRPVLRSLRYGCPLALGWLALSCAGRLGGMPTPDGGTPPPDAGIAADGGQRPDAGRDAGADDAGRDAGADDAGREAGADDAGT